MSGEICPCGSGDDFSSCCGPYLKGEAIPATAEKLMRSRYTAFATGQVNYIFETHDPETRSEVNLEEITNWSEQSSWEGLDIVATEDGKEADETGRVEFIAHYAVGRKSQRHHELSTFCKKEGKWFFTDGALVNTTVKREGPKLGRNDPCSCGSGKKFKKCCAL